MERRDKQIGDNMYSILTPPVRKAMPLCTRVAVLIGPVLGTLAKKVEGGGMEKFSEALQKTDPEKVDGVLMEAVRLSKMSCNGEGVFEEASFERHFNIHRGDVYVVSVWCLWECVKDFFPQQGAFAQILKTASEKASQSLRDGVPIGG